MIFTIDNQISFPVYHFLDSINVIGDKDEAEHALFVHMHRSELDPELSQSLTELVGTKKEFDLALMKDDKVIWNSSKYALLENFYVEISTEDNNSLDEVSLKFLFI